MSDSKNISSIDDSLECVLPESKLCTSHETLQYLEKTCEKYSKDPQYVFKSCVFNENSYLIVLKKLPETKTNELRKDVTKPMFAKFRANMMEVIEIIDILKQNLPSVDPKGLSSINPQQTNEETIVNKYNNIETIYSIRQTVYPDAYDTNINNVCSSGIHYFKSIEPAFMFGIIHHTKKWDKRHLRLWYDNGTLSCDRLYVEGKLSGLSQSWYENGQKCIEGTYDNDDAIGSWTTWYENGALWTITNYANGKESGLCKQWHDNGVLCREGYFMDGNPYGVWKLWDKSGVLKLTAHYTINIVNS